MRRTLLTATGWTAFIFSIYVFLGFRPAPPQSIGEGEVCYRCRHVITESRLAAEIMDRNLPTKYRTAGCMAAYAALHPGAGSRYYVTDFASGGLVDARHAFFVPVLVNDRTGERDFRAYHSRGMADIAAQVLGERVLRWEDLLVRARARA
ncbi:MAG TPA: hypothetical protein VM032_15820 [Vicinamibacterales bacterium]|nr:hypothetical protein [Vicinamibacterales bacterium]